MVNSVRRLQEMKAFVRMSSGVDLRKYGWYGEGGTESISEILAKTSKGWKKHDPYDVTPRVQATMNLYNDMKTGACSVLRPWQGYVRDVPLYLP